MPRIESLRIPGPVGPLEALLKHGSATARPFAGIVCHPHPLHGGTMHNKVVFNIAKALGALGAPVLRFNFRGVGASAGAHDEGRGEREDVRAALDYLVARYPHLPLCLAGFSFGSWVGTPVGCADDRVTQLVAVGTPTRIFGDEKLAGCRKRKLFIQGGTDEHGPVPELERFVEDLPEPKRLVIVPGADHFFTDRQEELRAAIADYFAREGPPAKPTHTLRERGPSNSQR